MLSVILLSMVMILLSTLKCDQASDLWEQLDYASVFESDLTGFFWKGGGSGLLISILENSTGFIHGM